MISQTIYVIYAVFKLSVAAVNVMTNVVGFTTHVITFL